MQTFHGSISLLRDAVIGFNMLGGISPEQAKKVADMLNEHILDLFVSVTKWCSALTLHNTISVLASMAVPKWSPVLLRRHLHSVP